MDELCKQVTEATEKEFQKKKEEAQKEVIRAVVQKTLERIDELDKQIKELEEKRKLLRLDLEDLKSGKLGLIEERQKLDKRAKEISTIVIKEVVKEYVPSSWYQPYYINWNDTVLPMGAPATYYCGSTHLSNGDIFTCSSVKDSAVGTYLINGKIVNFR